MNDKTFDINIDLIKDEKSFVQDTEGSLFYRWYEPHVIKVEAANFQEALEKAADMQNKIGAKWYQVEFREEVMAGDRPTVKCHSIQNDDYIEALNQKYRK